SLSSPPAVGPTKRRGAGTASGSAAHRGKGSIEPATTHGHPPIPGYLRRACKLVVRTQEEHMRTCECGCGTSLDPNGRKRFVDNAHRMRAARNGADAHTNAHIADTTAHNAHTEPGTPPVDRGRVRAGLETWLADQIALPEAVVEAARVLADELDDEPD